MVDASTSTVNYTDASTQFPEWMSVPVRAMQTSEKATSTFDIPKVEQPAPERMTSRVRSSDSTRKEEILLEPTPVDSTLREELIRKPSVPEPPKRPEPTPCEEPIVEEIRTDAHTGEIGSDEFIFIQDIGPDEEADLPTRQMPTRQEPIRQTTVGRETAQETVRQEVIREHAPRVPPESDLRPSEPASRHLPEREEIVLEESPRLSQASEPQARESQTSVDTDVNQPESTRESQPRPSTSGEGIRRTTTSGDRINITQSENEIRINTTDPENGSYSIDIDPKKHDKVVLTFANNSTVFVLDGANHTLGLNQGVEPGNIASERLTMQRVSPEPVGGLIGGPTPVDTDTIPVTKDATPDQRDPEGRPTERRPEKFTISPDDLVHPPPPYTTPGFPPPSYLPDQRVIPDDRALRRLTTLLELTTISNLAQLSRPASYTPTTDVRVDHNPHDPPSETTSLRVPDSDGEEITAAAPESTTPAPVDPFSTPSDEGESITGDLEDSSEQQPQPRPRADANGNGSGSGIGRSSSPITIALEEDDNESGSDFTLDLNATDTDENMCETREDSTTNESTYTFKSTTRCTEVRIDHITIWKKGDQNFNKPGNVKYNKSSNVITISDGTTGILYKLVNGTWQFDSSVTYSQQTSTPAKSPKVDQKSTVTKNPVQLNIKKKNSTEVYNYVKENKTGTYTAKEGFGFNSVVSSGSLCCQSNINIWDARVKDQYGNKVVVDGLGNKKKTLTIHFDDDDKKITFKKDDKEWMQHESVKKEKVIDPSTDLSVTTGGGQSVTVS
nr:hypothetical protein MACL_00002011 [Theileria orientalis]